MDPTEKQKVLEWLRGTWRNPCPMCGEWNWAIADEPGVIQTVRIEGGPMLIANKGLTVVLPTCTTCGFVAPVVAKKVGLID